MEYPRQQMSGPERLVVTGVDGIVGANLALWLADRFEVVGLFDAHPVSIPGVRTLRWDPESPHAWRDGVLGERPHWIIHCGPPASGSWDVPEPCPDGQREARTCRLLADLARRQGSRLTVISSDAVFAGPRLFHDERSTAASAEPFARAVRQAEETLQGTSSLLVRTHAYGWAPAGTRPGFAERAWQTLLEGRTPRFDPDRHATPILATTLAELVWLAYRRGLRGTYHVAGAERTSADRFAAELAAAFGLRCDDPLSAPDRRSAADPFGLVHAAHLHETSLHTGRARRDLGRAMPMLREGLERFAEQAATGYRALLQCSIPEAALAARAA
jgi:dTDP-4-dehydrorhamnose reductase